MLAALSVSLVLAVVPPAPSAHLVDVPMEHTEHPLFLKRFFYRHGKHHRGGHTRMADKGRHHRQGAPRGHYHDRTKR